jgi:hypothetical protein
VPGVEESMDIITLIIQLKMLLLMEVKEGMGILVQDIILQEVGLEISEV